MTAGEYATVAPGEREITLIQRLADYPAVVAEAGRTYSPALIANYAYDLIKKPLILQYIFLKSQA